MTTSRRLPQLLSRRALLLPPLLLVGMVLALPLVAHAAAGWLIDPAKFHVSAHGQLSCLDCHAEAQKHKPHPDPARVDRDPKQYFQAQRCYECHAEVQPNLAAGRHGRRAVADPARYAYCLECHDPHATAAVSAEAKAKFQPGVPRHRQCGACHAAQPTPPAPSADVKQCYSCHMSPAQDSPQAAAQATQFCLNCHGQTPPAAKGMPLIAASFKKDNPHQEISCLTCHPGGARYPHNGQAAVDCRQCHQTRHDEKTAGGDLHLGVGCQACHLAGVKPWKDAKTGRVLAQPARMEDGQTTVHSLAPAASETTCARCHQPGNAVGAATMVLPAKSVICMPCHTATFSAGDSVSVVALIVFAVGLLGAVSFWFSGAPAAPAAPHAPAGHGGSAVGRALTALVLDGVFQRRLWRISPLRGLIHNLIFFPFLVRFVWGIVALLGTLAGPGQDWAFAMAAKNEPVTALVFDLTGLMVVLGVAGAMARRFLAQEPRPAGLPRPDWLALGLMAGIVLLGFILEAARIAMTGAPAGSGWAFVGYGLSQALGQATAGAIYGYLWYGHAILTGAFLAYLPFSRMFHILLAPIVLMLNALRGHDH